MSSTSREPGSPAQNVRRHDGVVTRHDRYAQLSLRGATLWFTGLSASGKSTIAAALEAELIRRKRPCYRLDGDNLRLGLNSDLGFSHEDRHENIRRVGEVARLFADAGVITLASFISPYRQDRELCRGLHQRDGQGELPFFEIFVDAPIAVCERRDPKGLYRKARAGQLPHFTGIDDPYEPPLNPELTLKTESQSVDQSVQACILMLTTQGIL